MGAALFTETEKEGLFDRPSLARTSVSVRIFILSGGCRQMK